jgi:hypothetical protein
LQAVLSAQGACVCHLFTSCHIIALCHVGVITYNAVVQQGPPLSSVRRAQVATSASCAHAKFGLLHKGLPRGPDVRTKRFACACVQPPPVWVLASISQVRACLALGASLAPTAGKPLTGPNTLSMFGPVAYQLLALGWAHMIVCWLS